MLPFIRWTGLCVLIGAFVLPVLGADEKDAKKAATDDPEKKGEKKTEKKVDDYVVVGTYDGQVKDVSPAQKTFTLVVMQRVQDPEAAKRLAQLQAQLAQQRNAQGIYNLSQQIAKARLDAQRGVEQKVDKLFEAAEDVKVRINDLPVEYDDKGKVKKYTKAELATKKGGANLWGYPAEFEQVSAGQYVKIILGVKKTALKKKTPAKKGAKSDDDDMEDGPQVREIRILGAEKEKK
jgi:hypothetical protein